MNKKQSIYIIWNPDTNRVKVGISDDVYVRYKALITASGCPLILVYSTEPCVNAKYIEQQIHTRLKEYRYIGEWFNTSHEFAKTICIEKYNRHSIK
jgi:hypothetical protein